MLVLGRTKDQSVMIGDDLQIKINEISKKVVKINKQNYDVGQSFFINNIKITIVSVIGKMVKLGIDAPKNISVHREEIYDRIQIEKNFTID